MILSLVQLRRLALCLRLNCSQADLNFGTTHSPKLVDDVAKELHAAGRIRDPCADADFFTRLTKIEAQFPSASVLLHKRGVLPPAVAR